MLNVALRSALAFGIGIGVLAMAGTRTVYAHQELHCARGQSVQPVSIAASTCMPDRPGSEIAWPHSAVVRHEVGLYLANLRVRVFHYDQGYGWHWLAWGVPAPPY